MLQLPVNIENLVKLLTHWRETSNWDQDDLCRPITRRGQPSTWRIHTIPPNKEYL